MTTQPYPRDPFRASSSDQPADASGPAGGAAGSDDETKPVTAVKPTPFARVAARLAEVTPGPGAKDRDDLDEDDLDEDDLDEDDLDVDDAGESGDGQPGAFRDGPPGSVPAAGDDVEDSGSGDEDEDEVDAQDSPVSTPGVNPVVGGPVLGRPALSNPLVGDSVVGEPVVGGPVSGDSVVGEPVPAGPVVSGPAPIAPGAAAPGGMAGVGGGTQSATPARRPAVNSAEWSEIKALFVDDPASSVRLAVKQVELAVDGLTAAMKRAQDAAASSDQASAQLTEHLRTTLLAYQEVSAEIGRLTERLPGPQSSGAPSTSLATTP